MRLKNEADSITPAANPSTVSSTLWETFLTNKTGIHPIPVARPAMRLTREPSRNRLWLSCCSYKNQNTTSQNIL
ncbi:MAG: hypothetical protein ACTSUQ_08500 [Candidatus Freyarchaeota archaeon]